MTEPSAPKPRAPRRARLRADRLREGAAAGDDHAQPARPAERARLPDAARARAGVRGRVVGRRDPRRRAHRRGARVLRRRRPQGVVGRVPRQPAGLLEVVRRLQGRARPPARDRQADARAHQRHLRRRRQRVPDGVRPRGDGRRRVHPPRRPRARLGARGRRDAVAADHGRGAARARDHPPLRGDSRPAGCTSGGSSTAPSRPPSSTRPWTSSWRSSRRSSRRRRATRSTS